jgi:hypothetical protein
MEEGLEMTNKLKFTTITRTICPITGVHYLDAIDEHGNHWMAQQETNVERWITYKELWHQDPQQPVEL